MKYILSFLFLMLSIKLHAQQVPIFTQSQVNPFLINPAYAGESGWANVFLHTRNMWSDMPDAPQQYYITADGVMPNPKIGLGFTAYANIEPIIRNTGALATYRYKLRLADEHFLSGAISAGFIQNRLSFDKAIVGDESELSDFNGDWSKFNFDFNLGLLYQFKTLQIGIVARQLANTPFTYEHTTSEKSLTTRRIRHYEFSAAYDWRIGEAFSLKPLFIAQSTEGMPFNFMANASFSYMDKYWIGIGYKLESAYSVMAGLVISDRLVVGYNCDIPANDSRSHFGITQEIAIGYRLLKQTKKASASETRHLANVERLQELTQRQSEDLDRLKQSNQELRERMDKQESLYNSKENEMREILQIYSRDKEFIDSLMLAYSVDTLSLTDEAMQRTIHYVVLGAYYNLSNAKVFQKILEREINLETRITTSTNGRYYFVYSKTVKSKEEANIEFKRLMQMDIQKYIYGNLWIYKNENE